jgi:osmotically-inducible protein OsmY
MKRSIVAITVALAAAAGCAHHEQAAAGQPTGELGQAKQDFVGAYDSVKMGAERSAVAGKYALEDVGRGVVRVTDASKKGLARAGTTVEDGWITTKVKSEYALNKGVSVGKIRVDTDEGVVRLSGTVDDAAEAQRAIQIALGTKGVVAVDSDLQFPARKRPARTYYPKDQPPPPAPPSY